MRKFGIYNFLKSPCDTLCKEKDCSNKINNEQAKNILIEQPNAPYNVSYIVIKHFLKKFDDLQKHKN